MSSLLRVITGIFAKPCLLILLLCAFYTPSLAQTGNALHAARLFGDNMVLQQGIHVPVWGFSGGGEKVTVEIAGESVKTTASPDGKWMVKLPVLKKGGPYELVIRSYQVIRFKNVMVGEVWLASGQSNMEFPMGRPVLNGEAEMAAANRPMIREFQVPRTVSSSPQKDLEGGEWKVCSPASVRRFSAVAYYFANKLSIDQKVAVGIINSSVGGTKAEAWTSAEPLLQDPEFAERVKAIKQHPEPWAEWQKAAANLWDDYNAIAGAAGVGLGEKVHTPAYDDSNWSKTQFPLNSSHMHVSGNHLIWYRKHFTVPSALAGKNLFVFLGRMRQRAVVYLNGTEIGRCGEVDGQQFSIAPGIVHAGENLLAIKLLSLYSYGLVGNPNDQPALKSTTGNDSVSLAGEWLYNAAIEPALPDAKSYQNEPTALYNAMINPLVPFGIKGVIWYQGEANTYNAGVYDKVLSAMIKDWRKKWNERDLPFLFVQLPNYLDDPGFLPIREAQQKVLALNKTGMAVTIDLGDDNDIHPVNKKPVAERLYVTATKVAYGNEKQYEGPYIEKIHFKGSIGDLEIGDAGDALVVKPGRATGFELAGDDRVFYPAVVKVKGKTLIVSSDRVSKAVALRYAWKLAPSVSIYNSAGLPLAPYRSDDWKQ